MIEISVGVSQVQETVRLHRAAARISSDTNLSKREFGFAKETRRTFRREIPLGLAIPPDHTVPYGTVLLILSDAFPRHFVPGYDRTVPPGHISTATALNLKCPNCKAKRHRLLLPTDLTGDAAYLTQCTHD
jgi:hypothetical protein